MSSTEKNRTKRSYDFTPCLPFWDALTSSQQQMLRLNTIVRSYRAGDNVVFSMPERNGLFLVLSGGLRVFIATDTGREITLLSVVSGGCCVLNTLDSAEPGDTMPILQASSDAVFAYINIVALRPLCAEAPVVEQFLRSTAARNVQKVLNNIEYYFHHHLLCVGPFEQLEPPQAHQKDPPPLSFVPFSRILWKSDAKSPVSLFRMTGLLVAPAGVEPTMGESKSPALPLGDGASCKVLYHILCFSTRGRFHFSAFAAAL